MSLLDSILSGTRNIMVLQYKVEQFIVDVNKLDVRQDNLADRLIRVEVIIAEAQRGGAARRPALPNS